MEITFPNIRTEILNYLYRRLFNPFLKYPGDQFFLKKLKTKPSPVNYYYKRR